MLFSMKHTVRFVSCIHSVYQLYVNYMCDSGVGKHYIGPVGRPTRSIDPVGQHYISHEAGS